MSVTNSAVFSPDGAHRFRLTRTLGPRPMCRDCADRAHVTDPCLNDPTYTCEVRPGKVLFVMLNPSIADADFDDPTIRKCKGFAARWGYFAFEVVNLFSFRATKPADLWASDQQNTLESDEHILAAVAEADRVVFAWGQQPKARVRARIIELLIRGSLPPDREVWCIDRPTKSAMNPYYPRHPLMLAYAVPLVEWPRSF